MPGIAAAKSVKDDGDIENGSTLVDDKEGDEEGRPGTPTRGEDDDEASDDTGKDKERR